MNIPIENFIPSGAGLVATIASLVGMWFKFQNKVETLEEDRKEVIQEIKDIWNWKNTHEKDAMVIRDGIHAQISELKGSLLVTGEQFKQIMDILKDIKERLSQLENSKN